ncbi:MAG: hypothetical protein WCG08_15560 [Paludibacter sp.]
MRANFNFNNVGQGGFYTGHLNLGNHRFLGFNFVYDCGTLSERKHLTDGIQYFKSSLRNNILDVLFVSHLDDDHVNGIRELLTGLKCERIYLPYLTPIERLIVAIRHGEQDVADMGDFLEFLKSPYDYLTKIEESEISRIIYIKRNSDEKLNTNQTYDEENPSFELTDLDKDDYEIDEKYNINVEFRKGNGTIKWHNIWEFYLYHEPAQRILIQEFTVSLNKLYNVNAEDGITQNELEKILEDNINLDKLRKQYRDKFKDLNKTGLIVQHKPLGYKTAQLHKIMNIWSVRNHFNPCCKMIGNDSFRSRLQSKNYDWGVTLLTGDIPLIQIDNSDYIKNHLDKVFVFQVPHHGSKTNWVDNKLSLLNNKGKTTSVICFGYGNQYGHPRPEVLSDLEFDNFDVRFCTQFENFEYQIILT